MIKVVTYKRDIIEFLESEADIPKWLVHYKKQMQAELDLCRKTDSITIPEQVTIKQDGDTFIFIGAFREEISFVTIEPWRSP